MGDDVRDHQGAAHGRWVILGLSHFDTNPDSNLFSAFSLLTHLHLRRGNKIKSSLLKKEIPAMRGSISSATSSQNHGIC